MTLHTCAVSVRRYDGTDSQVGVREARMRFTTERYEQMVSVGILTEDDRVELIDGEILEMAPSSEPHSFVITSLISLFSSALLLVVRTKRSRPTSRSPRRRSKLTLITC